MSETRDAATAAPATSLHLRVNGVDHTIAVDPRTTLVDALRFHLGLMGTKLVCSQGACGACTVLVDGQRVTSCIMLAVMCDGRAITTIEGVGTPEHPHPIQQAFVKHDALQCGFCTAGQIVAALALVQEQPDHLTLDDIRLGMSGNLCRCGAYVGIRNAIKDAAATMGGQP